MQKLTQNIDKYMIKCIIYTRVLHMHVEKRWKKDKRIFVG